MRRVLTLVACAGLALTAACNKDQKKKNNAKNNEGNISLVVEKNGTIQEYSGNKMYFSNSSSTWVLTGGNVPNDFSLNIITMPNSIQGVMTEENVPKPGTYRLGHINSGQDFWATFKEYDENDREHTTVKGIINTDDPDSGTLTISSSSNEKIEGSFKSKFYTIMEGSLNIIDTIYIEGKFKALNTKSGK